MRFQAIASQAALIVALLLGSSLAYVRASAAQQPISRWPRLEETDHVQLSTPVVKAWREIPVGSSVYALDDAVGTKDWLERALIQHIEFQTGKWDIWIEPGYSVFRIYPYLFMGSPQPSVYQGIVLKVKGTLSVGTCSQPFETVLRQSKSMSMMSSAPVARVFKDTRDRTVGAVRQLGNNPEKQHYQVLRFR